MIGQSPGWLMTIGHGKKSLKIYILKSFGVKTFRQPCNTPALNDDRLNLGTENRLNTRDFYFASGKHDLIHFLRTKTFSLHSSFILRNLYFLELLYVSQGLKKVL